MIIHDVEQGSPQWWAVRVGMPTASGFDQIVTPAKLEVSKSAYKYRNKLVAEWIVGYSLDQEASEYMERGKLLEPRARSWYEMHNDVETAIVGFMTNDEGTVGGSPDSLIDDDGLLEIKCPGIINHVGYMLDPSALVAQYKSQVQGYFFLTGRAYCDLLSFHPELPPVVERVVRDEKHIAALAAALPVFVADLEAAKEQLKAHRRTPMFVDEFSPVTAGV